MQTVYSIPKIAVYLVITILATYFITSDKFYILDRMEYKYHKKQMHYSNRLDFILKYELGNLIEMVRVREIPFDKETIKVMATYPKIAHDIHLPIQSGCDKILKLMNRKYAVADYLKIIETLREYIPDIHITTDIICGFPGETEEDFATTVKVVEQIKFSAAYIFPYSNRSGTVADKMENQVPFQTRKARATKLVEIMRKMS